MGLDWDIQGCWWSGQGTPDWTALHRAVRRLPIETVHLIDSRENLANWAAERIRENDWELDYELTFDAPDDYPDRALERTMRHVAAEYLERGITSIRQALETGSLWMTFLPVDGITVFLDGGLFNGEGDTISDTAALAITGLLGRPLWPERYEGMLPALPPTSASLAESYPTISVAPKLVVAELPCRPDWERALQHARGEEAARLIRFVSTDYEPFSFARARLGAADLWIADHNDTAQIAPGADSPGAIGILHTLARTGALTTAGGCLLNDLRLRT